MQLALLAAVVLRLANTDPQSIPELATVTRSTADIREASANPTDRTITVNGTTQQNAIAEWLVSRLDTTGPQPAAGPFKAGPDDMVRVFYLNTPETVQQVQEIGTVARSIAEVPRAFIYTPAKALVARGTADQIALLEWLIPHLDVTGPRPDSPSHLVGGKVDDVARVFYLSHAQSIQELQEMTTGVRSVVEIRRAFTYNRPLAVVLRASPDQIAAAEFFFRNLDKPPGQFSAHATEHRVPTAAPESVFRLFAVPGVTVAELLQKVRDLRAATGIRRAFTYNSHRAILVCGTPEQITAAERFFARADLRTTKEKEAARTQSPNRLARTRPNSGPIS